MTEADINLLKELKQANGFSDNFVESVQDGLLLLNSDGKILVANSSFSEITGFNKKDLLAKKIPFPFWPKELHNDLKSRFNDMLTDQSTREFETSYVHKDGNRFPVVVFLASIKNNKEEAIAYLVIVQDLLKRNRNVVAGDFQNSEVFSILNYRKKYLDLIVEKKITSHLDTALNNISDGFVSLDNDWCYTYVNINAGKFLGREPSSLIGKNIWTLFPDAVGLSFYNAYHKAKETQQTQTLKEYYKPFGKWFENRIYPTPEGLSIYFTDITESIKIEKLLIESERYLNNIVNNIGDPVFVKDAKSKFLLANDAFYNLFNRKKEEIVGRTFADDVPLEERERYLKIDKKVISKGVENIYEDSFIVDGKTRYISTKKTRFIDENGDRYLIGVIRDITKLKEAEMKIRESESYLQQSQKVANIGSYSLDVTTMLWESSEILDKILGVGKNFLKNYEGWISLVHPDEKEELIRYIETDVLKKGDKFNREYRIINQVTKKEKWVHGLGEIIKDSDGNPIKMIGTTQDITERKQIELELKSAKEFSDKLIMSMQEGLLIVNLEGKIILVNDSFCKILGYSNDELIGMTLPYPFAKQEDFEEMSRTKDRVATDGTLTFQFEFLKKNNEPFIASFSSGNIKDENGEVIALFGTMKDVSEEQRAKRTLEEIALKSTQKKDVILKLASHVGKDFNTALTSITREASTTLDVERVSVWSFNACKNEIYCEQLYTKQCNLHSSGYKLNNTDNPAYFKALETTQTILVENAIKNTITKKFAKDYLIPNNIKSLMDVFIHSTNGYYGIICFEHVGEKKRNWTADEQEFAISIASIVSLMVESFERKVAEKKIIITNEQLVGANKELNTLRNQLEQENVYLRNELDLEFNYEQMVYGSAEFSNVITEVEKVAPTNATVLLLGESGTGKELLAKAIHNTSLRNKKPLIKVNCSAIPRELIESELFGHKKGSFTGAFNDKIGKFELADGGTLFLDEIGELPLDMQPKILRFLQEGEIEVVGGTDSKKLDVRVIAATNRNLKEEIEKKQFREDLYFRLNVFPIEVPPLRYRTDDIPLLVEHFVEKFNITYEKDIKYIPDDAMIQLKSYNWPGNIRELENLIERAAILSTNNTLYIPGFETDSQKAKQLINNKDTTLDTIQRNHIIQVLEQCDYKISGPKGACVILDLKPSTLRDKMKKLNIKKPVNR